MAKPVQQKTNDISEIKLANPTQAPGFRRHGQAWFCTSGFPSDIIVEVNDMLFHLHKFPLISKSAKLSQLVAEADSGDEDDYSDKDSAKECRITLQGLPGGPDAFELVAKFCYGDKIELNAANAAPLRCAAEYLGMTEEYVDNNLITVTEGYIDNIVIRNLSDSVTALKSCENLLPIAEDLSILSKCVESIASKICSEKPHRGTGDYRRSLNGKMRHWDGSSPMSRVQYSMTDWWYDDVSCLNFPLFKCVIICLEESGVRPESIGGMLMHYAKMWIPGLNRRQDRNGAGRRSASGQFVAYSDAEQLFLLESIESLLPLQESVVPTNFLCSMLKIAIILNSNKRLKGNLEKRIAAQLDQATVDDLLIPNYSNSSMDTLYDVDCVQRMVELFLTYDKRLVMSPDSDDDDDDEVGVLEMAANSMPRPLGMVAKLIDGYLVEVGSDAHLKPAKFQALAEALPSYARAVDDGLYRSLDIFLKSHPWLSQEERERLCSAMDCNKLSLEACMHATQNDRLPLRMALQVLFLEQEQLRGAIMGCLETASRPSAVTPINPRTTSELAALALATSVQGPLPESMPVPMPVSMSVSVPVPERDNNLREDLTGLRKRIADLERECVQLRRQLRSKSSTWANFSAKFSCRNAVSDATKFSDRDREKLEKMEIKLEKEKSKAPAAPPPPPSDLRHRRRQSHHPRDRQRSRSASASPADWTRRRQPRGTSLAHLELMASPLQRLPPRSSPLAPA